MFSQSVQKYFSHCGFFIISIATILLLMGCSQNSLPEEREETIQIQDTGMVSIVDPLTIEQIKDFEEKKGEDEKKRVYYTEIGEEMVKKIFSHYKIDFLLDHTSASVRDSINTKDKCEKILAILASGNTTIDCSDGNTGGLTISLNTSEYIASPNAPYYSVFIGQSGRGGEIIFDAFFDKNMKDIAMSFDHGSGKSIGLLALPQGSIWTGSRSISISDDNIVEMLFFIEIDGIGTFSSRVSHRLKKDQRSTFLTLLQKDQDVETPRSVSYPIQGMNPLSSDDFTTQPIMMGSIPGKYMKDEWGSEFSRDIFVAGALLDNQYMDDITITLYDTNAYADPKINEKIIDFMNNVTIDPGFSLE